MASAAVVKGSAESLGLQSLGRDLGVGHSVHVYTDSSAAMGMVARKGIGRVRHVEVSELWGRTQSIINGNLIN